MDIVKKIKDERLILKTLKNIRIAFLFQSLGIIGILGYIGFTEGMDQITKSPLWLLFILTSIVLSYLQLSVSIDVEEGEKDIKLTPYYKIILRSLIVGTIIAIIYIIFSPERPLFEALLTGSIFFICFLISYSVSYFIKKRRLKDDDE
ncbi:MULTISPECIES: branched-chain amino acid ABC transporter substrate-binding protein [Bacillus cereus group]|uniref:Branched-chain amino acid ABC transporter substrate-binding protein n=1 Tax=Bacillus toyonensis TaxID=155322 RepID=A0AB73RQZ9_9BACI|nr:MULTISPECIES: branched-chain amino acid ABC transporter substrate-binding protein [Bacillus cereus group]MBJ7927956.1 branched-chain amino acid ABC transporter substrate-binding protein [Bacillus cereus group sp. N31]PEG17098.1 branched-chain amino acid ABC transporter substrate-binding protein [Bacillus toyonensis]PEI86610.1 branched-chain amino acid ABC transporter substrate-binding protein [Bacillus toyonensis]PEK09274.1 branched-chain amino acid ABC transporter substrate-binding protein 